MNRSKPFQLSTKVKSPICPKPPILLEIRSQSCTPFQQPWEKSYCSKSLFLANIKGEFCTGTPDQNLAATTFEMLGLLHTFTNIYRVLR